MKINEITVSGNAGRTAEIKTSKAGEPWASFSLCFNHRTKDGKEVPTWFKVNVFGKNVEIAKDIQKGDYLIVRGMINIINYPDKKTNESRTSVEINASHIGFLVKRTKPQELHKAPIFPAFSVDEEDIPF